MQTKTLIQSLDRAIEILEIVRDSDKGMRAMEIARKMGLPLKTAHNLIRSLLHHGYLTQDGDKNYWLGPDCFLLADQAKGPFFQLGQMVAGPVQELSRTIGRTVFFATEYGGCLYCVAITRNNGYSEVNGSQPWLHIIHAAAAAGRILWAEHDDEELKKLLAQNFTKFTRFTKNTPSDLMQAIRDCRRDGYSVACDENAVGYTSLAIPVRKSGGELLGALTVSLDSQEWRSGVIDLNLLLKQMHDTAEKLVSADRQHP